MEYFFGDFGGGNPANIFLMISDVYIETRTWSCFHTLKVFLYQLGVWLFDYCLEVTKQLGSTMYFDS